MIEWHPSPKPYTFAYHTFSCTQKDKLASYFYQFIFDSQEKSSPIAKEENSEGVLVLYSHKKLVDSDEQWLKMI